MLPNVIMPGAPKSGTTSFAYYINHSPEVYFKLGREIKYFYYDYKYKKGLEWYQNFFKEAVNKKIIFAPGLVYLYSEKALKRIKKDLNDLKFIIFLRNPVDRAYSQYNYCRKFGTEILSFENAIKLEDLRTKIPFRFFKNNYSYFSRGLYCNHLNIFFKYFDFDKTYICISEKFWQDPVLELKKICAFLDIEDNFIKNVDFTKKKNVTRYPRYPILQLPITIYNHFFFKSDINIKPIDKIATIIQQKNLGNQKPELNKSFRDYLLEKYKPYNQKLENLINQDLSCWNK